MSSGVRTATGGGLRLAVSNIAWTAAEDDAVHRLLREEGVDAIEIAPTRVLPDPLRATRDEVDAARRRCSAAGLEPVAFQSLLYTRPDAALFGAADERRAFSDHLRAMIALAEVFGVARLVLGSPRNRRRGGLSDADATGVAVEAFQVLGAVARDAGTTLCIEPNPLQYGCDFIVTPSEGAALVRAVGSPGFGLHVDTAGTVLAGVDPAAAVCADADLLRHVHVSAPGLGPIEDEVVPHARVAAALRASGYSGVVSIEMRSTGPGADGVRRVRDAVRTTRALYGI